MKSWNVYPERCHDVSRPSRQMRPAQVLVFGHSFVRRLNEWMIRNKGQYHNLSLDFQFAEVHWMGIGGLSVHNAQMEQLIVVEHLRPDVVYVELGTIDLCEPGSGPELVASNIHDLVLDLQALGVQRVIVGEVIRREGSGIPEDCTDINEKIRLCNQILKVLLHPHFTPGARFWHHKGM